MSYLLDSLKRVFIPFSIKPRNRLTDTLASTDVTSDLEKALGDDAYQTLISAIRKKKATRKERISEYKNMAKHPIVGEALTMIAQDATQFDVEREKTVWIESSDPEFANFVNEYLRYNVEPFIDEIAHSIVECGEFAFRVNKFVDKEGNKRLFLIPVKHLENLHHLLTEEGVHTFCFTSDIIGDSNIKCMDDESFIHFLNHSIDNSEEVNVKFSSNILKEIDGTAETTVSILSGDSVLSDKIAETIRILEALENGIISTRLAKSKVIRFINVNVPKDATDTKVQSIIQHVEGLVNSNDVVSAESGTYSPSYSQVAPAVVVVPNREGKGQITCDEFSSTVDIKDLADLDYQRSLLFAGLGVPPAFFGMDPNPGMGNIGSLVRMDIRYARKVKKVQRVIVLGVTDLVGLLRDYFDYDPDIDFSVRIVRVNSAEDIEKNEEIGTRISVLNSVYDSVLSQDGQIDQNRLSIAKAFFKNVISMNSYVTFLEEVEGLAQLGKAISESSDEDTSEETDETGGNFDDSDEYNDADIDSDSESDKDSMANGSVVEDTEPTPESALLTSNKGTESLTKPFNTVSSPTEGLDSTKEEPYDFTSFLDKEPITK